ncbi:MAG: hypothetical protein ACXVX5_06465, partial [Mycobacterium sp.]
TDASDRSADDTHADSLAFLPLPRTRVTSEVDPLNASLTAKQLFPLLTKSKPATLQTRRQRVAAFNLPELNLVMGVARTK